MTKANLGHVLDYLRRLVGPPPTAESDHCLLARFLATREEAAFASLLKRHGPMVFAVARRLLGRVQDAEDVVQATFLLLARKAPGIRKRASLGCWLYGVARRLSLGLKRQEMNRLKREQRAAATRGQTESPQFASDEIQELLDAALQELPEKFRAALILCCLEGRSQEEAAKQLGCPLGTVQSRLARGRKLLQKHLVSRGMTLSAGGVATFLTAQTTSAALPAKLVGTVLQAAVQYSSGKALSGLVSSSVAVLVNSGLKSLAITKVMWISASVLSIGLIAGGAGLAAKNLQTGGQVLIQSKQEVKAEVQQEIKPDITEAKVNKPGEDFFGDPLPPGAIARLGTVRLNHGHYVEKLSFSADANTLLSADQQGVYIWETSTGRLLRSFGNRPVGWGLHFSATSADHRIVALSTTDGIEIWDGTTGRRLPQLQTDRFSFYPSLELSADGKILAVLVQGHKEFQDPNFKVIQSLLLFDATTGWKGPQLEISQDRIHSVAFSRDGKTLLTASDDKSIRFWDVVTGKQVRQLNHAASVGMIAISPDGKTLASVATKKTENKDPNGASRIEWTMAEEIVLWDLAMGKETHRLKGHRDGALGLAFAPDCKTLVSSDWNKTHWWDVAAGMELPNRNQLLPGGSQLAFTSDGSILATGTREIVRLWDVATGKQKLSRSANQGIGWRVVISPDGRNLVTGSHGVIRIWDSTSGEEIRQWVGHEFGPWSLAVAPDGRMLISDSSDETVRVWDFATGKELRRFAASNSGLSSDGKFLVTASKDKFIRVWDIASGQELRKWEATGTGKYSIAESYRAAVVFLPDGKFVLSWSDEGNIQLWEIATGKELRHFEGNPSASCMALSPDGKLVAFGEMNKRQIVLCDVSTGMEVRLLKGLTNRHVTSLAFSTDNRFMAAGEEANGTVNLWEMATGQMFQQFLGHKGRINSIAFSVDGKVLLTGSADTTALAWDLTGTRTGPKAQPLTAKELESAWSDQSDEDAVRGQTAVRTLLAVPEQAVTFLASELKPAATPGAKRLAQYIMDLDSEQFKTRDEAMQALEKLGDVAAAAVRNALAAKPTLETKQRLEKLLEKFSSTQRLRTLRAVQVLEQVGTQPARELLSQLAEGVPDVLLTQEAKAAVKRLAKLKLGQ